MGDGGAVTSPPGAAKYLTQSAAAFTRRRLSSDGARGREETSECLISPEEICVDERGKILGAPSDDASLSPPSSLRHSGTSRIHISLLTSSWACLILSENEVDFGCLSPQLGLQFCVRAFGEIEDKLFLLFNFYFS